jgi:hypothetical protein
MRRFAITSAFAFLAAAGCAAPEPPANPSWDQDVFPILRGSCLGCHGEESANSPVPVLTVYRFDFCNPATLKDDFGEMVVGAGAAAWANAIQTTVAPTKMSPKPMPPPPAARLSEYEVGVLRNWAKRASNNTPPSELCEKKGRNRRPSVRLIDSRKDGLKVIATIELSDPDGDSLIAKATAGSGNTLIKAAGRREITIDNASGNRLEIKLSDGYETVDESFDL